MNPYMTLDQVKAVLKSAWRTSPRDHLIVLLSFQHGLRASEVAALTLADVADGYVHVARAKNSLETTQPLVGNENALLDEPAALKAWLEERPQGGDALFPSKKGGDSIGRRHVWTITKAHFQAAGIPAKLAHHHSLKHALASLLIRSTKDLSLVKQALGHRAISSTIHYVHTQDSEAMQAVAAALDGSVQ